MPFAFHLLGRLGVRRDGTWAVLPAGKPRSLLAALLLNANRLVPVENLVDALWDNAPPRSAVANVRTYAVGLRRVLADPQTPGGSRVSSRERAYRVAVEPGELDLAAFTALAAQGRAALRAGDAERARDRLTAAVGCWREQHAGLGVPRLGTLGQRLAALDEERLRAAEDLAEARLGLDDHDALIGELRRTVVEHPLRERSWCQLMRALYRAGDVSGALRCYVEAGTVLREEIGVDPGPELRRLHAAMLARDPALDPAPDMTGTAVTGAAVTGMERPRQLPPAPAVLVGRDEAVARVRGAVEAGARVVDVYGPPGAGTSALAIHAAHLLSRQFPGGQLYAHLGATDTTAAAAHLLSSLGVPAATVPPGLAARAARLRTALAGRRMLLLIDGVDDAAQVRPFLPADSGCLTVLVSGRPLATIEGVALVRLAPLTVLDGVTLLQSLHSGLSTGTGGAAVELVELCDGLPLAVRIVAARLLARPDRTLADHLRRLREPGRRLDELCVDDLSVRASLAARCAPLTEPVLTGLRWLARLPVPATARELAATTGTGRDAAQDALDGLLDAQLVTADAEGRHRIAGLVRLFALELSDTYRCI